MSKVIPLSDILDKLPPKKRPEPRVARRRLRAALVSSPKLAPVRDERWEFTPAQVAEVKKVIAGRA